jgi:hypothetical protein
MSRRFAAALAIGLLIFSVWWFSHRSAPGGVSSAGVPGAPQSSKSAAVPKARGTSSPVSSVGNQGADPGASPEERSPLADRLNAPDSDIHHDLLIVQDILIAWRTNFPHGGNPVGENDEITAALTGKNPLKLALIPKDNPAINDRGELCDRWGTPFHFHQISGTQMELRSAGPDRKFGTADDSVLSP